MLIAATLAAAQQPANKPRIVPGRDPGGVAVAIIGSGVNYTLPALAGRLARDGEGDIVGLDFEDRDNRPFDRSTAGTSGTEIASVVVAEAPKARLVPVRVREGDTRAIPGILAFVASSTAAIAVVPSWMLQQGSLAELTRAAAARPTLLLVVAAGDEGANLAGRADLAAIAALANVLVVTATDADGKLLATSNHGSPIALSVSARRLKVFIRDGKESEADGSSIAAARVAALAARLKAREPALEGGALRAKIVGLAKAGVMLDPLAIESAGR